MFDKEDKSMRNYIKFSFMCFIIIVYITYSMVFLAREFTIVVVCIIGAYLVYFFKITDKIRYILIPVSLVFNFMIVVLFVMGLLNIYNPYKNYDLIKVEYGTAVEQENYFKLNKMFSEFNLKYEKKMTENDEAIKKLEVNEKTKKLCLESKIDREEILLFIKENKIAFPKQLNYKKTNIKYYTFTKIIKVFYLNMIEIKSENIKNDKRYLTLWESIEMLTDAKLNIINEKYLYLIIQKNIEFTIERKDMILEKDINKIKNIAEYIHTQLNLSIRNSIEYQFDYEKNTIEQIVKNGMNIEDIKDEVKKEEKIKIKKFLWPFIIKDETVFKFSNYYKKALKSTEMNLSELLKEKERYREEDSELKKNIAKNIGLRNVAGKIIFHIVEYGQYVNDLEKKENLKSNLNNLIIYSIETK